MSDARAGLTAEERLRRLRRDQARVRRERMVREVAGPIYRRMLLIVPAPFDLDGVSFAYVLRGERAQVIEALREDAVFAGDTAMRLIHGAGFLSGGDVHAYLESTAAFERLARAGLIDETPSPDKTLVRPWPGLPRLLGCVVGSLPSWRVTLSGERVVTAERLRRELIGAVGARAHLFALLERLEARDALDGTGSTPAATSYRS